MAKEGEKSANPLTPDQTGDLEWLKITSQVETLFNGNIPDNVKAALKELVDIRKNIQDDTGLKNALDTFGDKYDSFYTDDGLFAKATGIVTNILTKDSRKLSEASQGGFWGK